MDCGGDYLCTGLPGYDARPVWTPNGNTRSDGVAGGLNPAPTAVDLAVLLE